MNEKSYELNAQSFNSGRVVLYQRAGRKKSLWQARIKVPNGAGYIIKSTKTEDFNEAYRWAENFFDEMRLKQLNGKSVRGKTFAQVWKDFEEQYPENNKAKARLELILGFLRRYAAPYFEKMRIDDINSVEITKFFDWRKANPIKTKPTNSTLISEMGVFKTFMDWAYQHGHASHKVEIEKPKNENNRRPHFDEREYSKLTRHLREWVKRGANTPGGGRVRARILLTNYVLILANTGIRVGEARGLRWLDISTGTRRTDFMSADDVSNKETEYVFLQVKGKTGAREVVARTDKVKDYFQHIRTMRIAELNGEKPKDDEFVFCHPDGSAIDSFTVGFRALLQSAGVEFDKNGQRHTIYSLRHTYATFRLQEGVHHYSLAQNMGTSVEMLENFYGHTSNRAMAQELTKTARAGKKLVWD